MKNTDFSGSCSKLTVHRERHTVSGEPKFPCLIPYEIIMSIMEMILISMFYSTSTQYIYILLRDWGEHFTQLL